MSLVKRDARSFGLMSEGFRNLLAREPILHSYLRDEQIPFIRFSLIRSGLFGLG